MLYLKIDWVSFDKVIDELYQNIKKIYIPDYIISIGRGGLIPSRMLSDKFNIYDISIINVRLYKDVKIKHNKINLKTFNENIENKKVLLVDDICDTGETVDCVVDSLRVKKYKDLKTATLFCRETSKIKPSFIGKNVKDEWVIFPWEKTEFKHLL